MDLRFLGTEDKPFYELSNLFTLLAFWWCPVPWQQAVNTCKVTQSPKGACSVVGVLIHRAEIQDWLLRGG